MNNKIQKKTERLIKILETMRDDIDSLLFQIEDIKESDEFDDFLDDVTSEDHY